MLVEQNPDDEPAQAFLRRHNPNWFPDGKDRGLPPGWTTCPLGDLGAVTGGGTPSKSNKSFWNGEIPWVSPKDMKVDYIHEAIDNVTDEAIANSAAKLIQPGSLLFVVRGMILAHSFPVAITDVPVAINQDMKAVDLGDFDRSYVLVMMKGLKREILSRVERSTHGTCKLVSDKLWSVEVPVPPKPEQTRISEKVAALIRTCSDLRNQVILSESINLKLVDTLTSQIH